MGDTGSLSLGGALGAIAVVTKHEIVLAIIGGLFVVEAIGDHSGGLFKAGKRVFLWLRSITISKRSWAEPQIVIRFWIIALFWR